MTTYTAITAAQTDADSYLDTALIDALKNNCLSIQEGDASAPRIQFAALDDTAGQAMTPWELIETQVVASGSTDASVDFESLDSATYKSYMLRIKRMVVSTGTPNLWLRIGTGSMPITYQAGTSYQYNLDVLSAGASVISGSTADAQIVLATSVIATDDDSYDGVIYFGEIADTFSDCRFFHQGAYAAKQASGGGSYKVTTAVTALRLLFSTSTVNEADISLYGVRQ